MCKEIRIKLNKPLSEQLDRQEIRELITSYLKEKMTEKEVFCRSSKEVFDYLYVDMRDLQIEVFKVIYLNNKNRIIACEDVFKGSLTSSSVYPRELLKRVLDLNASTLILCHNHPSGVPEPSDSDKEITEKLSVAFKLFEVNVLDHIIIGFNTYFSFADNGILQK